MHPLFELSFKELMEETGSENYFIKLFFHKNHVKFTLFEIFSYFWLRPIPRKQCLRSRQAIFDNAYFWRP